MMVNSILILLFALLKVIVTQITIRSPIELQNKFNGIYLLTNRRDKIKHF